MKSVRLVTVGLLAFSLSLNCFAICEAERAERDHFAALVDGASKASAGGGIGGLLIGTALGGPLGGILGGLIGGLAPGPSGSNWTRIYEEKVQNLKNCEENYRRAQQLAFEKSERIKAEIIEINKHIDMHRSELTEKYKSELKVFALELRNQGFDMEDPGMIKEVLEKKEELEEKLQLELNELESERQNLIQQISR